METNGDLFEGLDDSEKEILEREIRDGRVPIPARTTITPIGPVMPLSALLEDPDDGRCPEGAREMRDLRDQSALGAKLLNSGEHRALASQHLGRPATLSELYDYVAKRSPEKLEDSW